MEKEKTTVREEPIVDTKVESLKVKNKPKPKNLGKVDKTPVKINLNKKEEDAVQEQKSEKEMLQSTEQSKETGQKTEVELQEVGSTHEKPEKPTEEKEEVTVINASSNIDTKSVEENLKNQQLHQVPENLEKLVNFMKETGGTLEDYVRLNADYSNIDNTLLLKEYYKQSKPYLEKDEIELQLEDQFGYDEDYDDEKTVRRKKLAMKEEIAKAKNFLEETKSKYYDEIKLRPGTTQEQQKAMDFFNRYNKEQEIAAKQHDEFKNTTQQYFSDFKGFDFNIGEKKFRYKIGNPSDVANKQSNIGSFVKTFLNEDGTVNDYDGYHKAIYAARNADQIAKHFYDQGVSDATKKMVSDSKNINKEARPSPNAEDLSFGGMKIKAVTGIDSSKLKIKRKR